MSTAIRTSLPAEPRPEDLVALVDTREQLPFDLSPLQMEPASLPTGDYSLKGLEHVIAIERKSLADLIGCVGGERERFEREVQRLLAYPVRALVIECDSADLELGGWRGKVTPSAAMGSVLGWTAMGLPVLFAGGHERAGQWVSRILYIAARRRWREARALLGDALDGKESEAAA